LPKLHKQLIGPPISEILRSISIDERLVKIISREFRWHYDDIGVLKTKLFPDIYDGLQELNGRNSLFISTNKPWYVTQKVLKLLKINHFFSGIFTIDSGGVKNKSDIVSRILLTGREGSSAVIGDSSDDLNSALDNRIDFIYCSYGYGSIKRTTNLKIASSPSKMVNFLLKLSK
jgi:phosphoglycolate phosphatase